MDKFLLSQGLTLDAGKMLIPTWVRTIKLDVGLSSNAPQSEVWLDGNSGLLVFGFEPVSGNVENLIRGSSDWKIKLNPERIGKTFYLMHCALGSKSMTGPREMYVTEEDAGRSSLLKPMNFSIGYKEVVDVFTLSDFLSYFPFNSISIIDHLKIDVQGADFEVLKGASVFLRKIVVVTVEVDQEDYENTSNNFKMIRLYMLMHGHIYLRNPPKWNLLFNRLGLNIRIETHDPTFLNIRHLFKFKNKSLVATQIG